MQRVMQLAMGMMLVSAVCHAGTWRVELDGSGDFTVVQDAVDAASPGDTILVGPGRFETVRPVPYWEGYSSTISIMKGGLIVEGVGPDQTSIGTDSTDWYYRAVIGWSDPVVYSFTLKNVTITGGYNGLHYEGDELFVEHCDFTNSIFGAITINTAGCTFINCNFYEIVNAFSNYNTNSDVEISGCHIDGGERGIAIQYTNNAHVSNCVIDQSGLGIQFDSVTGSINNCQVYGVSEAEYGGGINFTGGSQAEMNDCTVDWSMTNSHSALRVINGSILSGSRNTISGGGLTSILVGGYGDLQGFYNNEIFRADTYCLVAQFFDENFYNPNIILDMPNNYWGTDEEDLIDTWIDDANDHPNDPNYRMVVNFQPILTEPLPVKKKSLGSLKSIFR